MEFVFEPDLVDGEEAAALVKELAFTLQLLGVCTGKMEGHLQVQKYFFFRAVVLRFSHRLNYKF